MPSLTIASKKEQGADNKIETQSKLSLSSQFSEAAGAEQIHVIQTSKFNSANNNTSIENNQNNTTRKRANIKSASERFSRNTSLDDFVPGRGYSLEIFDDNDLENLWEVDNSKPEETTTVKMDTNQNFIRSDRRGGRVTMRKKGFRANVPKRPKKSEL